MAGLDKVFDYSVPEGMRGRVRVGTIVRVPLHGRRVRGWVVEVAARAATEARLLPIAKVTGWGPDAGLIDLAGWAAWRWAGRPATFLRTASPPVAVAGLPPAPEGGGRGERPAPEFEASAFAHSVATVTVGPGADPLPFALAAPGDALVLVPSLAGAADLARRLRGEGRPAALLPAEWARAAAGGSTVVGARAAAWAPVPRLGSVLVWDEHDDAWQEERAPTWHARDVAVERGRRAGVPVVLASPCPTLEALRAGRSLAPPAAVARRGWPAVEVVDRRAEVPGLGLYSERLVHVARGGGRVLCVLNRLGRARLLACAACGELARCEACQAAVGEGGERGGGLACGRCGTARPRLCAVCGATRLKVLRFGVARARDDLERLVGEPVDEVTATSDGPRTRVAVGTEALLHRVRRADVVAFLDFDQELLATRFRAGEQALALLARAARVAPRLLVQTRVPDHEVVRAAVHGDPARVSVVEEARRIALRLPPETALAVVSGEAAAAFVEGLAPSPVEVLGPARDRWLVRAPDHRALCDALAAVPRPPGRLRVEVDPLRA